MKVSYCFIIAYLRFIKGKFSLGKPIYPPQRDDDLFSNHSSTTGKDKNDLLDKLFGGSDKSASKNSNNNNNTDFLQKKLDKLDDFPDGSKFNSKPIGKTNGLQSSQSFKSNTTQNANTSKVPFLPWDLPEAQVGTPSSTKRPTNNNESIFNTSSGSGGGGFLNTPPTNTIRRPRETNTILTSNKPTNHSNNFIEDIEELAL